MTRVCLDLFSGLGGFSAAFADSDEWEVVTVDLDPDDRFDPDLRADVMDLRPADLFDAIGLERDDIEVLVILGSPPCTDFSNLQYIHQEPGYEPSGDSVALVYHAIGLIKSLSPDWWILENPQGMLRKVIGLPEAQVDYCAYGHYTKKPTDLWGDHPPMTYRRCPHNRHKTDGLTDFERGPSDPAERAKVPYDLSLAIREAVEDAYRNPPPEQATLTEVDAA